jgi:hypothetical protein
MERLDYGDAKMFYEEGLDSCDIYSIKRLTSIWFASESMRPALRIVMGKSLECLQDLATQTKDTTVINQLIVFYKEGIGGPQNEQKADFWTNQLKLSQRQPVDNTKAKSSSKPKAPSKTEFFAGYSGSLNAPVGLNIGLVGKSVGFYLRYRTNMSFQNYTETCNSLTSEVPGMSNYAYQRLANQKSNILMASGGLIVKAVPELMFSVGGGFWSRSVIFDFQKISKEGLAEPQGAFWAKSSDLSEEGVVIDLDATFRIGKTLSISLGCSALSFKYLSPNAGIGIFF